MSCQNYNLLSNQTGNDLNYNSTNYNNYQSWSNVGTNIKISSIDDNGNIDTVNQETSKLQRLKAPYSTFTDVNLSWVNESQNK